MVETHSGGAKHFPFFIVLEDLQDSEDLRVLSSYLDLRYPATRFPSRDFVQVRNPVRLKSALERCLDTGSMPDLILLDIMIPGISDLECIGIANAPTNHGVAMGIVLAERWLRAPSSPYVAIPLLFWSIRNYPHSAEELIDREVEKGHAAVGYVSKNSPTWRPTMSSFLERHVDSVLS